MSSAAPAPSPGDGQPYLELEFWLPDSAYVAYMRERGYFARYGDVRMDVSADGTRQRLRFWFSV